MTASYSPTDDNGYSHRVLDVVRRRARGEIPAWRAIVEVANGLTLDEFERRDGAAIDAELALHFHDTAETRLMEAFDYLRDAGEVD